MTKSTQKQTKLKPTQNFSGCSIIEETPLKSVRKTAHSCKLLRRVYGFVSIICRNQPNFKLFPKRPSLSHTSVIQPLWKENAVPTSQKV